MPPAWMVSRRPAAGFAAAAGVVGLAAMLRPARPAPFRTAPNESVRVSFLSWSCGNLAWMVQLAFCPSAGSLLFILPLAVRLRHADRRSADVPASPSHRSGNGRNAVISASVGNQPRYGAAVRRCAAHRSRKSRAADCTHPRPPPLRQPRSTTASSGGFAWRAYWWSRAYRRWLVSGIAACWPLSEHG